MSMATLDLKNLSGLNAVLGNSEANKVFSMIAAVVRRELSAIASDALFFRHGGDEMSAFLIDTQNATCGRLSSISISKSSFWREFTNLMPSLIQSTRETTDTMA